MISRNGQQQKYAHDEKVLDVTCYLVSALSIVADADGKLGNYLMLLVTKGQEKQNICPLTASYARRQTVAQTDTRGLTATSMPFYSHPEFNSYVNCATAESLSLATDDG